MSSASVVWDSGDTSIFTDIDNIKSLQDYIKLESNVKGETFIIPFTSIRYLKYTTPSDISYPIEFKQFKTNS